MDPFCVENEQDFTLNNLNIFMCNICFNEYNSKEYRPKILRCGHTLCMNCVSYLNSSGNSHCPWCRENIEVVADNLLALGRPKSIQYDEKTKTQNKKFTYNCLHHNKDLEIFCYNCQELICQECNISDHFNHKNHKTMHIKDAYEDFMKNAMEMFESFKDMAHEVKTIDYAELDKIQNYILNCHITACKDIEEQLNLATSNLLKLKKNLEDSKISIMNIINDQFERQNTQLITAKQSLNNLHQTILEHLSLIQTLSPLRHQYTNNKTDYIEKFQEINEIIKVASNVKKSIMTRLYKIYEDINGIKDIDNKKFIKFD